MPELNLTSYDPSKIEDKWYSAWDDMKIFDAEVDKSIKPHTIMMPPPNVTGRLHMGHALQSTVQDVLTRLRRMQGYSSLWMPGIDHAGIATQNVVEKELKKTERITRHDLGREAFIERVWDWKEEYGEIIFQQMRKLGVSCDWRRTRFTMDDGFTRAVQDVFVRLYNEGLIYRGNYLVNWCPVDMTALSDEEVNNVERDGSLWHIRYPFADGSGSLIVATTRPETMFGDVAVAVNPEDDRYKNIVGKNVLLPLTDRQIPVIADDYVKQDFGAGALKITPGHDKNDFEIGERHKLPVISVINPDGTLNDEAGKYAGLDRFEGRSKVVEDLERNGLLEKIEDYRGTIPISSRSKAIIEPLISRQWFVKMEPLAKEALTAVRSGEVKFYPKRWENEYFRWLENIRDWTISRQLWWGHRIPVWYYTNADGTVDETRDFVVAIDQPEADMVQDDDVLDTWFSSWLWPFVTLGWPEENEDLSFFYPTQVLVSGYDILFFWIARMIMAGLHFTGKAPFRDIFITGMVKDKQGRWMSKSLGNGIDPLDMIEQYGADAVRYSLTVLCAQGQDIKLDPLKFEMGRNFANKIWNAFNVFGKHLDGGESSEQPIPDYADLELVEKWMLHRLNKTIDVVDEASSRYRLNEALMAIYDLFWRDYCDWFLELIKPEPNSEMSGSRARLAGWIYGRMLHLLHPFMPFITEELWTRLGNQLGDSPLASSLWPTSDREMMNEPAAAAFEKVKDLVVAIRNIRAQYNLPPRQTIDVTISLSSSEAEFLKVLTDQTRYFEKLVRTSSLKVGLELEKPPHSASAIVGTTEIFVALEGLVDIQVEKARLEKEIQQKEKFVISLQRKLQNEQFVAKAPQAVVDSEREKEREAAAELAVLRSNLEAL